MFLVLAHVFAFSQKTVTKPMGKTSSGIPYRKINSECNSEYYDQIFLFLASQEPIL